MEGGKENNQNYQDDQHEIAAFMRMFMDMVGVSDSESMPTG
jgi:hypothetical protein